ncbi:ABC transporter ATP-binding protein [Erysipelothrix sp. D19-032]
MLIISETQRLSNVSVEIPFGYSVGIIGPNGAGKSTFIKALLNIVKASSGDVTVDGEPIKNKQSKIAYVPQKSDVDLSFPITVEDTVLTGTYPNIKLFRRPGKKEREIVKAAMEMVDITNLAKRQISNLSGGQLQRVFIARALARQVDVFFLDEPFVGIDLVGETIIVDLLKELRAKEKQWLLFTMIYTKSKHTLINS